jgi:EpsD family peptidyl-prolyl cis-trans isomerase
MTRDESASPMPRYGRFGPWLAVLAIAGLAACGNGDGGDKPASQVAAKVNKEELSVHQLNHLLQQRRGLAADQVDVVSRQLLERLIDQELALQKASELRIDRDPAVLQRLEAARRDIVARAYIDKVGAGATPPTPAEIRAFYEERPALFKERRVYNFRELAVEVEPEKLDELRAKYGSVKSVTDIAEQLEAAGVRHTSRPIALPAERLPLDALDHVAKMKDGDINFGAGPNGVQILQLVASRAQPVTEQEAAPAIAQFLLNDRRRKLVDEDLKALRAAAKVEYVGAYAQSAASAAAFRAAEAASAAGNVTMPAPVALPAPALPAASALEGGNISEGLGLKAGGGAGVAPAAPVVQSSGPLDMKSLESGMGLKR